MLNNTVCQIPITEKDILTVEAQISAGNGRGNGAVALNYRKIFSSRSFGFINVRIYFSVREHP